MSKWINADELKQSIDNCFICNICPDKHIFCSYDCDFPDVVTPKWEMLINAQPSIDLVRCKECKHWVSDGGAIMFCEHTDVPTDADDYCSWGERSER